MFSPPAALKLLLLVRAKGDGNPGCQPWPNGMDDRILPTRGDVASATEGNACILQHTLGWDAPVPSCASSPSCLSFGLSFGHCDSSEFVVCQHVTGGLSERADSETLCIVILLLWLQVESAVMMSVDRLGITTQCRPKRAPDQRVNVRLAFPEPADSRGAVKEQLVAMTRAGAAAGAASEDAAAAA